MGPEAQSPGWGALWGWGTVAQWEEVGAREPQSAGLAAPGLRLYQPGQGGLPSATGRAGRAPSCE